MAASLGKHQKEEITGIERPRKSVEDIFNADVFSKKKKKVRHGKEDVISKDV